MARIYRTRGIGKRLVVRKKVIGISTTRGVSQPTRKRRMRVKKSKPRRSPSRSTKQRKRKVAPVIVRARQRPFIRSDLPTIIKNNIEGGFQLDFPAATYNYSIGGSLDYFIEKVRNDLSYLYQKYAEPDVEESDVTKPVTEPEFNTKFNTLAWKQLALRPRFRIRRRRTMKTFESLGRFKNKVDDLLSAGKPGVGAKLDQNIIDDLKIIQQLMIDEDDDEHVFNFILRRLLEKEFTISKTIPEPSVLLDDISNQISRLKLDENVKRELIGEIIDEILVIIRIVSGEYKQHAKDFTERETRFINNYFSTKLIKAWENLIVEYDYDEQVPTVGSAGPSGMKALKLRAPATNLDFYNYLCFLLEPHHDFHGDRVTLKTKSKGSITTSNKDAYKVLKRVAEEYDKKTRFNIDDFTDTYVKNNYDDLKREFTSYDEFTNLLKIMKKINASQNSVTLSFKEAVDNKITKDSLNKVWGKGFSGQDLALHELIEEVAKLVSGRGIYRDAGGSVFLGRIADLEKQFATDTNIKPLIEKIKSSTEFAERLFDGAGQSNLSGNDEIKVDYFGVSKTTMGYNGKVFNGPEEFEINKYINPQNTKDLFNYILINPSIAQGTRISVNDNVSYKIAFPKRVGKQWKVWTLEFDSVVYDLSLLIRYYLDLTEKIKLLSDTDLWGNGNTKSKAIQECKDMIWVLLNLKRMGDHGQAERAKVDGGIFESGDQLAAAYGMMIDVPTIVTYSRQGFGNHFILYGADLDLGQLKDMINKYLEKIPAGYTDLKNNIQDKTTIVDKVDANKILTLVSGIVKLNDVFTIDGGKGKKTMTLTTVLQTIVGSFEKMKTDLLGGASGRESTRVLLKALPWKTLLSLFTGGKKKLKSDIEIMVNTFMLLINILGEMYNIATGLDAGITNQESKIIPTIKTYIKQRLQPLIPIDNDKTILKGIKTNIEDIIEKLGQEQADSSSFGALTKYVDRFFGDIQSHIELEFKDILIPINDFITKIEKITTEINENSIEDTLNKFNVIDV